MDSAEIEANSKLNSMLEKMVQITFVAEGKLVMKKDGLVLYCNVENLSINLGECDNFLAFLSSDVIVPSGQSIVLNDDSATADVEFSTQNESEHFRVLIWPISYDVHTFFMAQIFRITESTQAMERLSNRRKSVENELFMRTQEIMMTEEAMAQDGGFLTNFLRGLRHDLISPITQLKEIIGFYQKTTDPAKKQKAAELIDGSLQKLSNTASGFSEFVDLHFIHKEKRGVVDLRTLIDEACEVLKLEIADTNAVLCVEINHKKVIFFNQKVLESIIYNLLSNAIKFRCVDRPLMIYMTTYDSNDKIVFEIKDNGIGIDMDRHSDKLFKPFSRLSNDKPGVGIGLSMVENILTKNNGSIKIESELHNYTKIIVSLPTS